MIENTVVNLRESLRKRKLIVFGHGKYFQRFSENYPEFLQMTECILDSNCEMGERYSFSCEKSIPIIRPQEIKHYNMENYVVLYCSQYKEEMKKQLETIVQGYILSFYFPLYTGYDKYCEENVYERIVLPFFQIVNTKCKLEKALSILGLVSRVELEKKLKNLSISAIVRMPVILTSKCTLRCRNCSNLMGYFEHSADLEKERILQSLDIILKHVDILPCCELIGGEPFAAKNLGEILEYVLLQDKILSVEITTNATIIPEEKILSMLKNEKITVVVSNYGKVVNQKKFMEKLDEYGINNVFHNHEYWISVGGVEKRNRTEEELKLQYDRCGVGKTCKTLWEDRIFPCARAASLFHLGYLKNEQSLKISDRNGLKEDMMDFFLGEKYNACDYCDMAFGRPVRIPIAEQNKC